MKFNPRKPETGAQVLDLAQAQAKAKDCGFVTVPYGGTSRKLVRGEFKLEIFLVSEWWAVRKPWEWSQFDEMRRRLDEFQGLVFQVHGQDENLILCACYYDEILVPERVSAALRIPFLGPWYGPNLIPETETEPFLEYVIESMPLRWSCTVGDRFEAPKYTTYLGRSCGRNFDFKEKERFGVQAPEDHTKYTIWDRVSIWCGYPVDDLGLDHERASVVAYLIRDAVSRPRNGR